MGLEIGAILNGKITGITKFGAFVSLEGGKTGMVHISEVSNTFVNDIREHLSEGQDVTVKVIGVNGEGRVNLSIKKAVAPAPRAQNSAFQKRSEQIQPNSFEDKLKAFMQNSDSKMSDLKQYIDKKGGSSRRGGRGRGY